MTLFGKKTEPQPPAAEPETPASPQPEAATTRPLPLTTASEAKDFIRDQIFLRVELFGCCADQQDGADFLRQ